jgi:hypothetical protein
VDENDIIGLILLVVGLILIAILVMRYLRKKREAALQEKEDPEWMSDIAHNQVRITKNLVERQEREGIDVSRAKALLEQAEERMEAGDYEHAQSIAKSARAELAAPTTTRAARQRVAVRETKSEDEPKVLYRDLSARVGDKEEAPTPAAAPVSSPVVAAGTEKDSAESTGSQEDEVAPMQGYRKTVPKNYLEARFELQMLDSDIKGRDPKQVTNEVSRILSDAQRAFDREDYTESLRLAIRGRRILGATNMQTIAVSQGTTTDTPPTEPSPVAQRSSAPPAEPDVSVETSTGEVKSTTVVCSRCRKQNPAGNRFCRGCGLPLAAPKCPRCLRDASPDDAFCGSCGSPLNATV